MSSDVTIDLSNYKDKVGQRVSPGRYRVVVDDAEVDTAKSGNQMINMWLRVLDGDFASSVVIDRLVLTQNSLFRVVGFMQAIGMPTPKKAFKINMRQIVGRVLEVELEDGEPFAGRVKSEVRAYYRAAGQPAVGESAPDDLSGLDEFSGTAETADQGNGSQQQTAKSADSLDEVVDLDTLEL